MKTEAAIWDIFIVICCVTVLVGCFYIGKHMWKMKASERRDKQRAKERIKQSEEKLRSRVQ